MTDSSHIKPFHNSQAMLYRRQWWHRIRMLFFLLLLMGAVMIGRLFYLQLVEAGDLKDKASHSRQHAVSLVQRGQIQDRHGVPLAQDGILYDLYAHPAFYGDCDPADMAAALAPALGVPEKELSEKLHQQRKRTIRLANNLTKEQKDTLSRIKIRSVKDKMTRIKGLDFSRKTVRQYPQGELASHVLGYVNQDARYSSGVEAAYEYVLGETRHVPKGPVLDGNAQPIDLKEQQVTSLVMFPKAEDVTLTLDARLQFVAEKALTEGIKRAGAKRGAVIMMEPSTGDILAYAVAPSYNPEQYFKTDPSILKNWSLTDVYPPGSTMKILTVASGLETGVIEKESKILDTGRMTIGGWPIENYDYYKHPYPGNISLAYLLEHSSNIASAKISMLMAPKQQHQLLSDFGFGQPTGIDLKGESSGILPDYQQWDKSTQASLGYGYGVAATPLQMVSAINVIANQGVWVQPHVVKQPAPKVNSHRVVSAQVAQQTGELLYQSIQNAKTSTVRIKGVAIAGKTGTSRKPNANGKGYSKDIFTSFAGFYPVGNPKLTVFVVVDSPTMYESWGSTVAGPIFKQIAEETLDYLNLRPKAPVAEGGATSEKQSG